jgi:hypothetical protein
MSRGRKSNRPRMIRVSSDDETPSSSQHQTIGVPSTRYELLSNGNLSSTTQILHVAEKPDTTGEASAVLDASPALNFDFPVDPAYLERFNDDFFPTRGQRTYVSIRFFIFLVNSYVLSRLIRLKDGLQSGTPFSLNFIDGKAVGITPRSSALVVGKWKILRLFTVAPTVQVLG